MSPECPSGIPNVACVIKPCLNVAVRCDKSFNATVVMHCFLLVLTVLLLHRALLVCALICLCTLARSTQNDLSIMTVPYIITTRFRNQGCLICRRPSRNGPRTKPHQCLAQWRKRAALRNASAPVYHVLGPGSAQGVLWISRCWSAKVHSSIQPK